MTPGARVQAAIELLDEILVGAPAEQVLTAWARRSRFAGSKDRAAVRDHVFQALRCRRSYAARGGAETGRGIMIGAVLDGNGDPAEIFTGQGHAPAELTEAERARVDGAGSQIDEIDLPDWIFQQFINSLGGEAEAKIAARALRTRAPVILRVNARKGDVAGAVAALAQDGVSARTDPIARTALVVTEGARAVARSAAYLSGLVEIQDGSSQAAMEGIEIPDGARVLDYCAGGGGKVLALAARAEARWFAHDALPQRLKDLPDRAARAGVDVKICDGADLQAGSFDLVLCDVPCSGSGTWRRSPDAKWRLTEQGLQELQDTQDDILSRACTLVAPGGCLAYATCSVFKAENENRIDAFLDRFPEWHLLSQTRWPISESGDGFFVTHLKRM